MKITRVRFSNGDTSGFLLGTEYVGYQAVLNEISSIPELTVNKQGVVRSVKGTLPEVTMRQYNSFRYSALQRNAPLVRDIQGSFSAWQRKYSSMALYLSGARQVGKTTELLKFAYNNYEQVLYVDLSQRGVREAFESAINRANSSAYLVMSSLCRGILGERYFWNAPSTILLVDEIQESPTVYNYIRKLLSLECHLAVTGSYLGRVVMSKDFFLPAGSTYDLELQPLSFKEFCRAFNAENTLNKIDVFGKSDNNDYVALTKLYELQLRIGGYPAVVQAYKQTGDVDSCVRLIANLLSRFTDESSHYFVDDKSKLIFENVYRAAVFEQLSEKKGTAKLMTDEITNFVKQDTKLPVSRNEVNSAISWLVYSRVLGYCDLYNNGDVSQLLQARRLYFRDCGLLSYLVRLHGVDVASAKGLLAETFVYNELYRLHKKAVPIVANPVPCCSVKNQYELDFLLAECLTGRKFRIKVKSNKGTAPKSLGYYEENGLIDVAVIAGRTRGGKSENENIIRIPIYTVAEKFPYI